MGTCGKSEKRYGLRKVIVGAQRDSCVKKSKLVSDCCVVFFVRQNIHILVVFIYLQLHSILLKFFQFEILGSFGSCLTKLFCKKLSFLMNT